MPGDDGQAPPPPRRASRLATQLAKQPLRRLSLAVVLVLLACSAAFGGLETVPSAGAAPLTELAVGSVVDTGPYRVEVVTARVVDDLAGVYKSEDTDRWVVVVVDLTGLAEDSTKSGLLQESVRAPDLDGQVADPLSTGSRGGLNPPRAVVVVADSSNLDFVPPGVTLRVALLWEQRGDVPPPTSVRVELDSQTLFTGTDGVPYWTDPALIARGDIAVTRAPHAAPGAAS